MASKNDDQTDAVQNVVLRAAVRHNWSDARIGMISRLMQKGGITSEISPHKPALRMRQPPEADNYNIFNFVKHDIPVGAVKDDGLQSATSPIQTARSALPRMMQPRNSGSALADMETLQAAKSAMPSAAHYLVEKRGPYVKTAFMSTPVTPIPKDRPGPGSGEESGMTNELGQPSSQMLEAARQRLRCSTQNIQALTGRLASLTPSAADLDLFPSYSTSAVLPNFHRPSEPTLRVHEGPDFGSGNLDSNEGSQLIHSDLQSPLPGLADQVASDSLVHGLNSGRSSMFQSQGATQNIDVSIASPRGTPVSIAETTLNSNFRSSSLHRLAASGLASSLSPLKTATGHFVVDSGSLSQRGRSRISFLSQSQLDPRGSVASASAVEVVDYKLFHGSMPTSLAGNVGEVAGMESVQECASSCDGGNEGSPQEPTGFTPVVDPMLEYMRRSMIQPTSQKTPYPSLGKVGVGDKDSVLSSAGTSYTPSSGIKPRGSPDNFLNKRRVSFQKPDNSTLDKEKQGCCSPVILLTLVAKVFSRRDHGKIGDVSCVDDGLVNCRPQNGHVEQGSVKPPGEQLVDPGPDHLFSGYRTLTRQDAVRRRVNFPDVLKEEEEENRELNPAEVVEVELRDDNVTPLRLRSIQQSLLRKRTLSYSGLYPEGSLHMSQDSFCSSSASGVAPPVGPTIALLRGPSLTNRNMRGLTQRSKSVRELMSGLRSRRVAQGRSDVLSQMFAQESSGEGGSSVRFATENVGSAVGIIAARELHKSSSCEVRALSRQSSSMVSDRQRRRSAAGNVLCRSALNNDLGLSAQVNNGNRGMEVEGQDNKNRLEVFDSNKEGLHGLLVSLRSMRLRSLDDEFPPLYPEMRVNN